MSIVKSPSVQLAGPGFVLAMIDLPFPLSLPNGGYKCNDPIQGAAFVEFISLEGCTSFFRDRPLQKGPSSFKETAQAAGPFERPRAETHYIVTATGPDLAEFSVLNINTKKGYSEVKFFTEARVYFLVDDIGVKLDGGIILERIAQILNPFLDKYRMLAQDYQVALITPKATFYLTVCQVSPLEIDEIGLSCSQLIENLSSPRTWRYELGDGGSNTLRPGNPGVLIPSRKRLNDEYVGHLRNLAVSDYDLPLSYSLILEAVRAMRVQLDYRLAIIHAATSIETHVLNKLFDLLIVCSYSETDAWNLLENDREYNQIRPRLKKLDQHTKDYCTQNALPMRLFLGTSLYTEWNDSVASQRNRALHAGANSFTYLNAFEAIRTAKKVIVFIEARIPALQNKLQFDDSMQGLEDLGWDNPFVTKREN